MGKIPRPLVIIASNIQLICQGMLVVASGGSSTRILVAFLAIILVLVAIPGIDGEET
jgi:hypothetical protein